MRVFDGVQGDSQQFVFGLDLNTGYTVVAGPNCQNCVTNSSLPTYVHLVEPCLVEHPD